MDNIWNPHGGNWGCTFNNDAENPIWVGRIQDIKNIISIELQVKQFNITNININGSYIPIDSPELIDYNFKYDVDLYGCYDDKHCDRIYSNNNNQNNNPSVYEHKWQTVLTLRNQKVPLESIFRPIEQTAVLILFSNTFQNQETLPTKGKVKSYLAIVHFKDIIPGIFDSTQETNYEFLTVSRPDTKQGDVFLTVLLSCTILIFILFCRAVYTINANIRKWLPEQKWLVFYLIALILYQNPVYCVICWQAFPSSVAVYMSYVLDAFAQAAFFTIWLLFSDGLRRKQNYIRFYLPKLLIGFLIFCCNIVVLTLQFPTITTFDRRSPIEAVNNWSDGVKVTFISFSFAFLLLMWIWTLWWFYSLWYTGRTLHRLPYMSTRYLQLSFRFFLLQATLVALFYVFQYFAVIYLILKNSPLTQNLTSITDNINTLFRLQTQLIGKQLFLTVYALLLAFLFLPAGLMEGQAVTTLAATYVINEDEIHDIVKSRRKAIRSLKALSQLAHAKAEVFCVDLALSLLDLSWEAYHDPKGLDSESGYGPMDLEKYNYTLVDYQYNKEHDTVCIIARHRVLNRLVVAFRGTSSKRHWNDNLNYTQRLISLPALSMSALDATDGLDVDARQIHLLNQMDSAWNDMVGRDESDHSQPSQQELRHSQDGSGGGGTNIGVALLEGAQQVGDGITKIANTVVGATIEVTADLLVSAASHTPGLKFAVQTYVHSGFWEAYLVVREFVHVTVRRELGARPADLFFTGHSLGGALATLAAADISINSLPRINAYHRSQLLNYNRRKSSAASISCTSSNLMSKQSQPQQSANAGSPDSTPLHLHQPTRRKSIYSTNSTPYNFKIEISLYSYGSPRVGNWMLAQVMDKIVPASFRVVVDGDIVSGVPPPSMGYKHVGTEVIVDAIGAGSIIVDPSFVERRLRTQSKSSVRVHSLLVYRKGLLGVKEAAEYMRNYARALPSGHALDTIRLALFAGPLIPEESSVRYNKGVMRASLTNDTPPSVLSNLLNNTNTDNWKRNNAGGLDNSESKRSSDGLLNNEHTPNTIKWKANLTSDRTPIDLSPLPVFNPILDNHIYEDEPVVHHEDDVKATEEFVTYWHLQQSLRVVPFRVPSRL